MDEKTRSPPATPESAPLALPPGTKSFDSSRSSLRQSFSSSTSSYRRRLYEKHVAVLPDGKFTFEWDEDGTGARPGEGLPRRHPLTKDSGLLRTYHPNVQTLHESFVLSVARNGDRPYLGTRERLEDGTFGQYQWKTYNEVYTLVQHLSMALIDLGMLPNAAVGLYSVNREEWCITEQACFASGLVTVPLYDTLGDEAIAYICNQVEMEVVFMSGAMVKKLLAMRNRLPSLKYIISFDGEDDVEEGDDGADPSDKDASYPRVISMWELVRRGEQLPFQARPPRPEDLCTICYTSGTTGMPKGVMLPHAALLADAAACLALCGYGPGGFAPDHRSLFELRPDDVHISYLPLAHIFERIVMTALTTAGASIGFFQGDTAKLMDDILVLRPTIFVSVPRLFNRVYDKVLSGVKSRGGVSRFLFDTAYAAKVANLREKGTLTHWLWDRVVFSKIRARLGGRVRAMLSGSAPISPEVMEFLRVCFSCEVYEGYGQTETAAGTCLTIRHDWTTGHVGIPAPCNEIKLVDVPDMQYTSADRPCPRGEICVRGPNCFIGYFRDEERTRESLDAEGWVHSGDIGEWDERGRLRIIDRKKNLFKLAQGEYIAPERVENVLIKCPLIAQAFLHGDSLQSATVAIIVPDREMLMQWAQRHSEKGRAHDASTGESDGKSDNTVTPHVTSRDTPDAILTPQTPTSVSLRPSQESIASHFAALSFEELCREPAVHRLIMTEIGKFGRRGTNELKGFEIPRAVYIESTLFSMDNGLLTATFKLKRNEALHAYKTHIQQLYGELANASSSD